MKVESLPCVFCLVLLMQSMLAGAFDKVGKSNEARAMLMDVFEQALKVRTHVTLEDVCVCVPVTACLPVPDASPCMYLQLGR